MLLHPSSAASQYHLWRALLFQGRYEEAAVAFHRSAENGIDTHENLGMAQLSLAQGNYDLAIGYLVKAGSGVKSAIKEYWFSAIYATKRDYVKALASLQSAFKQGFGDLATPDASPYFKHLRDDPRYQKLVEQ
jgi:tetratricopeptide (TPR) repeat protein